MPSGMLIAPKAEQPTCDAYSRHQRHVGPNAAAGQSRRQTAARCGCQNFARVGGACFDGLPRPGGQTEIAILNAASQAGIGPDKVRQERRLLNPYPFDSFRKRMTLVRATDERATASVKGAPKETLQLCDRIRWEGRALPLTDDLRRLILTDHDRMAAEGMRIVAEIGLLAILIAVPFLRRAFGLAPPGFAECKVLLLFPVVMLLLEEARKFIARRMACASDRLLAR